MIDLIETIKFMNDEELKTVWTSNHLTKRETEQIEKIFEKTADPLLFKKGVLRYKEDAEVINLNLLGRFKLLLDPRNGDAFCVKVSSLDFWRMAEKDLSAKYLRNQNAIVKLVAAKNTSRKDNFEVLETATQTRARKKILNSVKQFKMRNQLFEDLKALNYR